MAATPNELWLSDITEHWTGEGQLFLWAVKDVWSNRIVGHSIDSQMTSALAVTALNNAALRRASPRFAAVMSQGVRCTRIAYRSFEVGNYRVHSTVTAWPA